MALFVVNGNFDDFHVGEIIDCDPELWADYIDVDPPFLSPVDGDGNRVIELHVDPDGASRIPQVRQAGAPRAKPLVLHGDGVPDDVRAQLDALHEQATGE